MQDDFLPPMLGPYVGDYNGCYWNSQAYFAVQESAQRNKQGHALRLLANHDFIGLGETHSNLGKVQAACIPPGARAFWSHGTNAQAGIGFLVKESFLSNFNPCTDDDWEQVEPGRVSRLSLRGPQGSLDIWILYLSSGSNTARRSSMSSIADKVTNRTSTLSLCMGDWNFVMLNEDRWSKNGNCWSGHQDQEEAKYLQDYVMTPFGFAELTQSAYTHESALARSRLDRIYSNHAVYDQLDRNYCCTALPLTPLSAHRPISFSRKAPVKDAAGTRNISQQVTSHPDFARRVALEFNELKANDHVADSPIRQLVLIKRAMRCVDEGIIRENSEGKCESTDDTIGWILGFIRAAERLTCVA